MYFDLHVHTEFSCDSEAKMEKYVETALAKGITTLCCTDHVDLNPNDYGYNYYAPDRYFENYRKVRAAALSTACSSAW